MNTRFSRRIITYFLQGLLYIAPISITFYVIARLFILIDGLIPLRIPGLGLLIVLLSITLVGFIGSLLIRTPLSRYFNKVLDRIPLFRILHSALKDLMSAFVGQKRKFNQPVMVLMNRESGIRKLGFITEQELGAIGIGPGMVAVYLPHSYNFSGNLFIVPAANVEPIDAPATEVMKFIVSGGITHVESGNL